MFTNDKRQEERTGRYGTPRLQYLQELVTQFQNSTNEETKERLVANLANFAYDLYSYTFLRQLNVLELFVDCITEPNEKLVEFGIGGVCNSCADLVGDPCENDHDLVGHSPTCDSVAGGHPNPDSPQRSSPEKTTSLGCRRPQEQMT
ncbi:hypothetical protein TIFTF001_044187 [Ficus carica]|uniref:Armadillo repeat-containing protein 7 n=1 Tax=Ficus carica TaxID=3494 RepID=A0AA87Z8G0_FICCA|nr:hypothetical protein TIFTF001_044187 [Ficus carica]